MKKLILVFLLIILLTSCGSRTTPYEYIDYNNADKPAADDPWVVRDGDNGYYYCWTGWAGIYVSHCDNLSDVQFAQYNKKLVYSPPKDTAYSFELWAPELHYVRGNWYIYVAADDGDNNHHRMYVLKGDAVDPTKEFTMVGQISDSSNKWAIDGTVLEYQDELYFVWSGWPWDVNSEQDIYIAHMSDPCTIDSERVCLSRPEFDWEKHGRPIINEGPSTLVLGNNAYIVYSASGSWTDDYCLGMLTFQGGDILDANSWEKADQPIISAVEGTYGPGHCCFTTGWDDSLWMIYHANYISGTGWDGRSLRMQPVKVNHDVPVFGQALKPDEVVRLPIK